MTFRLTPLEHQKQQIQRYLKKMEKKKYAQKIMTPKGFPPGFVSKRGKMLGLEYYLDVQLDRS